MTEMEMAMAINGPFDFEGRCTPAELATLRGTRWLMLTKQEQSILLTQARAAIVAWNRTTPNATITSTVERCAKYCDDRAEWLLQHRDGLDHDFRAQRMAFEKASHEMRTAAKHFRALAPRSVAETTGKVGTTTEGEPR